MSFDLKLAGNEAISFTDDDSYRFLDHGILEIQRHNAEAIEYYSPNHWESVKMTGGELHFPGDMEGGHENDVQTG